MIKFVIRHSQFAIITAFLWGLLLVQCALHAAERQDKLSEEDHHDPKELTISDDKNLSGVNFKGKTLPQDLSYANLTNADLTGHHFRHTDFTGAVLRGVILTNTTCDYIKCFIDNLCANRLNMSEQYRNYLLKDLKSIGKVYSRLTRDRQKAELLKIVSGLAYIPYYESAEFSIKIEYWSCKLFLLKKQLGKLGKRLVCSFVRRLKEAKDRCWQTDYPYYLEDQKAAQVASWWSRLATHKSLPNELSTKIQYYLTEPPEPLHANFNRYIQLFEEGLDKYNVKVPIKPGKELANFSSETDLQYYRYNIITNIQGLKKAYAKFTSPKHQKEVMKIAAQLSKTYQQQHWRFLFSYLSCQNRLIQLKILAGGLFRDNTIAYSVTSNTFFSAEM